MLPHAGRRRRRTRLQHLTGLAPPAPELLDGGDWQVENMITGACTAMNDSAGGTMRAPFGNGPNALELQRHELAHVMISPKGVPYDWSKPLDTSIIRSVEDVRVNEFLTERGLPPPIARVGFGTKTLFDDYVEGTTENPTDLLLVAVSVLGTLRGEQIVDELYKAEASSKSVVETFRRGIELVRARPKRRESWRSDFARTIALASQLRELLKKWEREEELQSNVNWGSMEIFEPALTRTVTRLFRARKFRATSDGSIPVNPLRLYTDGYVFAIRRKHKVVQPTILLDASGSMHLPNVALIVREFPAATVASYSARARGGTLRILARDGRCVSATYDDTKFGGANVIDGPALDWLAQQPAPRYWISDGVVTEVDDNATERAARACAIKLRTGKITQFRQVREAIVELRASSRAR